MAAHKRSRSRSPDPKPLENKHKPKRVKLPTVREDMQRSRNRTAEMMAKHSSKSKSKLNPQPNLQPNSTPKQRPTPISPPKVVRHLSDGVNNPMLNPTAAGNTAVSASKETKTTPKPSKPKATPTDSSNISHKTTATTTIDLTEPSDPSETTSLPEKILPEHLSHLTKKYDIATMSLNSGSKIQQKATTLKKHLSQFFFLDKNPRPGVVALTARAKVASKLISVVEIVKRDIEAMERGGKWWQYSRVGSELREIIPKETKKVSAAKDGATGGRRLGTSAEAEMDAEDGRTERREAEDMDIERPQLPELETEDSDEESAFETMATPHHVKIPHRPKVRAMPVMTIYMSRVPIPELAAELAEQTNAGEK